MTLTDRTATVVFVRRHVERLDAERTATELGPALVTGIEQTVLDLAYRPELGGMAAEARASVRALLPRADPSVLDRLAADQRLGSAAARARAWAT